MTAEDRDVDSSQRTLSGSEVDGGGDPLFAVDADDESTRLIENRELLEVGMVPDSDRIVGRDDEIQTIAAYLQPLVVDDAPTPV